MKSSKQEYIEQISRAIEEQTGHKHVTVTSHSGNYCYFHSEDPESAVHQMQDPAVMVYKVTEMSVDEWVMEFKSLLD